MITHSELSLIAIEEGWYSTLLVYRGNRQSNWLTSDLGKEVIEWCTNNTKGPWTTWRGRMFFKEEKDFTWFLMHHGNK